MRSFVELENGERVPLGDLPLRVPRSCFIGETHLEVCERWPAHAHIERRLRDTYLNLLFVKSDRTRQITALITLIRAGKLAARKVRSRFIGPEYADLIGPEVELELAGRQRNAIRGAFFARFALKVAVHRAYRVLGRSRKYSKTVIRAWVDTTDATYPAQVRTEELLIYPFSTNWLRQLRYLRRCWQQARNFRTVGLPYRGSDVGRLVVGWSRRDEFLARGEHEANRAHARELLAAGVEHVLTGDEFEVAGHALHGELLAAGAHSTNTSHGVGVYGPCVRYEHFSFYNPQQRIFYARRARFESYEYRDHRPHRRRADPTQARYEPIVVYLQGNWIQRRPSYESQLEDSVTEELRAACAELGVPFVVKPHPNLHALTRARHRRRHGVELLDDLGELSAAHPVFVNLLSTAYYTCLSLGPTIFIRDDLVDPAAFFGPGLQTARPGALRDTLARFSDADHWSRCYAQGLALTEVDAHASTASVVPHQAAQGGRR